MNADGGTFAPDLVAVLEPRRMTIRASFTPRGGITTTVTAEHVRQHE